MTKASKSRELLKKEIKLMLGGGMVEVELDPDHYDLALDLAIERYRQRSSNSTQERLAFLDLQPEQTMYVLPEEVVEVRQIFRRGTTGTASGTGNYFDPFGSAFVNQVTLNGAAGYGDLVTYELYAEFQELVGRMFGQSINFTFNPTTKRLDIVRYVRAVETVVLQLFIAKPEEELFKDMYARPWLRDYASARCKVFLGSARGKFSSLVGPQGGSTLNGPELVSEGQADMERLDTELSNQVEQTMGYGFTIG